MTSIKITKTDLRAACNWVENKLQDFNFLAYDEKGDACFEHRDAAIEDWQQAEDTTDQVSAWCNRWLPEGERGRLDNSLRQRRYKASKKSQILRIDLTSEAHFILSSIAKSEGITMSQVIEKHLSPVCLSLPD